MATVNNEKELAQAIKSDALTIEIMDLGLGKKVLRIHATGKVAWAVAFGAIGAAVVAVLATPVSGGASVAAGLALAAPASGILGAGTVATAVAIAVAAGGVNVLNKLRKYKIKKTSSGTVVLTKK